MLRDLYTFYMFPCSWVKLSHWQDCFLLVKEFNWDHWATKNAIPRPFKWTHEKCHLLHVFSCQALCEDIIRKSISIDNVVQIMMTAKAMAPGPPGLFFSVDDSDARLGGNAPKEHVVKGSMVPMWIEECVHLPWSWMWICVFLGWKWKGIRRQLFFFSIRYTSKICGLSRPATKDGRPDELCFFFNIKGFI